MDNNDVEMRHVFGKPTKRDTCNGLAYLCELNMDLSCFTGPIRNIVLQMRSSRNVVSRWAETETRRAACRIVAPESMHKS